MQLSNPQTLRTLDHRYHLPLFTASAVAMHQSQDLSEEEADLFRMAIIEASKKSGEQSMLTLLTEDNNSGLNRLLARISIQSWNQLAMQLPLRELLRKLQLQLDRFSASLLEKSDLHFNQKTPHFEGRQYQGPMFISAFLIEAVELLQEHQRQLTSFDERLKQIAHAENRIAHALLEELDFTSRTLGVFDGIQFKTLLRRLNTELTAITQLHAEIWSHHGARTSRSAQHFEELLLEASSCLSILSESFNRENLSLLPAERNRFRIYAAWEAWLEAQEKIQILCLESFKPAPETAFSAIGDSDSHHIINHLLDQGMDALEAQNITQKLVQYCQQHQTSLDQLLDAELNNFHESLGQARERKLTLQSKDSVALKHELVQKKESLMQSISEKTPILSGLILLAFALFQPSCGVKTAPRSDELDLRPSVPYHSEQSNFPGKKTEKDKAAQAPEVEKGK